MTVLVKICGVTGAEDAALAVAAGADLVGFIFVPGTPRFVDPSAAHWISSVTTVETVGVFRDAPPAEVLDLRRRLRLDRVQLHGDEPDELLAELGPATLRRVDPRRGDPWARIGALSGRCLPLLDPGGGSGLAADWPGLAATRPGAAVFGLAGGLTPATVAAAITTLRPALVDVSSGVERRPRHKDPDRVRAFVAAARRAARQTRV